MATVSTHELAYDIERVLERRFRSLKVPKPKTLAEEITPDIIRTIPSEAFDPKQPWSSGHIFFHGDVEEERICDLQAEVLCVHENLKTGPPITIYLSTFGGDVFAGLALASTIQEVRRRGRVVNVHIQGAAFSMGSIIAQVADHRSIEPQAWFMVHELSCSVPHSKTSLIKDEAELMERLENQVFALYTERTGKPVSYWRKKMHRRDLYLSAVEALEEGLVDSISVVPSYPRTRRRKGAEKVA